MPKLSIIIPVYNVERYLHQCLDSILASTLKDYEIILVDDGSRDSSGEICDKYGCRDNRIKVVHQQNSGVSAARNVGINMAEAEWITFIDSDDLITKTYLENLYHEVEVNNQIDFVEAGCKNYIHGEVTDVEQYFDYYSGDDMDKLYHVYRGIIVSKLFRKSIISKNNISFPDGISSAEDQFFTTRYLAHIKSYSLLSETGYYYRRDNESSLTHGNSRQTYEQSLRGFIYFYDSMCEYLLIHKNENIKTCYRLPQLADNLSFTIFQLYRSNYSRHQRIKHLREDFLQEHFDTLRSVYGKKNKIIFFFLRKKLYYIFDIITTRHLKI